MTSSTDGSQVYALVNGTCEGENYSVRCKGKDGGTNGTMLSQTGAFQ